MLYYTQSSVPWSVVLPRSSFRILGPDGKYPRTDSFWDRRSQKSHDVFGIYSSGNLPALKKCHYINVMLPYLGQTSASVGCCRNDRGEGELSCKARGLKTMLSSCHCCVSFHVESFGSRLASSSSLRLAEFGIWRSCDLVSFVVIHVSSCYSLYTVHTQKLANVVTCESSQCLCIFSQWGCHVLCNDCEEDGSGEEEEDWDEENETEPVLNFAEVHTALQTVKSFFTPHVHNARWLTEVHLQGCTRRRLMQVPSSKRRSTSQEKLVWKVCDRLNFEMSYMWL
jgi:hypothetical protein